MKKIKIHVPIVSLAIFSIVAAACSKKHTATLSVNDQLELTLNSCSDSNEKKANAGSVAKICFTKLITESRCPANAICVWQGYAACEFEITLNGVSKRFNLSTLKDPSIPTSKDTIIEGAKITLINVLPYPGLNNSNAKPLTAVLKIEN